MLKYYIVILISFLLLTLSLACSTQESAEEATTTTVYQGPLGSPYTDQYGIEFIWIEPGGFTMGDPSGENEKSLPLHGVIISEGFYLGKYEVTQGHANYSYSLVEEVDYLWTDYHPQSHYGDEYPIDGLTYSSVESMTNRLSNYNTTHTYLYRLPTEAEWEYAARAGTDTLYYWGDDPEDIYDYEWCSGNSRDSTQAVGGLLPNPWGLHDMLGNVSEFVSDRYRSSDFNNGYVDTIRVYGDPATDPWYGAGGGTPVIRGGAHVWPAGRIFDCSYRRQFSYSAGPVGLRLVLDVYPEEE